MDNMKKEIEPSVFIFTYQAFVYQHCQVKPLKTKNKKIAKYYFFVNFPL